MAGILLLKIENGNVNKFGERSEWNFASTVSNYPTNSKTAKENICIRDLTMLLLGQLWRKRALIIVFDGTKKT